MSILLLGSNTSPLSVNLSTSSVFGGRHGAGTAASGPVTATPLGGVAPYTYSWTYFSGDNTMSATHNDQATTQFTASVTTNQIKIATWKLLVTDNLGNTAPLVYVDIDLEEINFN